MPMAAHWNWAVGVAQAQVGATHITVLQDRMQYLQSATEPLFEAMTDRPSEVISFNIDSIDDFQEPVTLAQKAWSGDVFSIPSAYLLNLSAAANVWHPALPKLMNCVVPIATLDLIAARFGSICGELAPDYSFAYRCLSCVEQISYLDRSCLIAYGLDRSQGVNFSRGRRARDVVDFEQNAGPVLHFAAPLPDVRCGLNAVVHEYCLVQAKAPEQLKPLDRLGYLNNLALSLVEIEDPLTRNQQFELLRTAGWRGPVAGATPTARAISRVRSRDLRSIVRSLRHVPFHAARLLGAPVTRPVWHALGRLGITPPPAQRFHFRSTREALAYAIKHPRQRSHNSSHLHGLLPGLVSGNDVGAAGHAHRSEQQPRIDS
jgi:hypothetical protein